jgi:hypothetical protein
MCRVKVAASSSPIQSPGPSVTCRAGCVALRRGPSSPPHTAEDTICLQNASDNRSIGCHAAYYACVS